METTVKNSRTAPMQILSHIRKNHAMEHATIHVLSSLMPGSSFSGYSISNGFWIIGKAELQNVQKAAEMAYARLNNGEKKLAIHPNCGTNLTTTGLCTAAAAMLATALESENESRLARFSTFTTAGMIGALIGQPLGPKVQEKITTDANVRDISIVSINCSSIHGTPAFFVQTVMN